VRRVFSTRRRHWRRVGSRATTGKINKQGSFGMVSSSLLFPAHGDFLRDLQQKKTHKQLFLFCFLFSDLLLSGLSWFAVLSLSFRW
jgi:uncharacterized membrane protein YhhN